MARYHRGKPLWTALVVPVLALGMLFLQASCQALEAGMITLNIQDNAKKIRIASGDIFRVELEQAGASGYTWEIQNLDADHLQVLETKTLETPGPEDFTGAPVNRIWIFKATMPGITELRICHYRPWEGIQNASHTFLLKIEIH